MAEPCSCSWCDKSAVCGVHMGALRRWWLRRVMQREPLRACADHLGALIESVNGMHLIEHYPTEAHDV